MQASVVPRVTGGGANQRALRPSILTRRRPGENPAKGGEGRNGVTMQPGVLFDTNVYRSLSGKRSDARFDALLESERRRQVALYAEPLVLSELLVHLADPQDPDFAWCRAAVVRVYRRCAGDGPICGIIRDSESRLAEAITGKRLEKHDAHTQQVCIMLESVALTPADQPLSKEENIRLCAIAEHFAGVEAGFADTIRRLQGIIGAILAEEEPENRRQTRRNAMKTHASEALRRTIAESLLRYVCGEAGLALPEPLPAELVTRVRTSTAAWIEFEAQLWRRGRVRRRQLGGGAHPESPVGPADRFQHRADDW